MIYSDFQGLKLSMLGFGSMRLPTGSDDGDVNVRKSKALVDAAFKAGINYFDTAWGYHMGKSETIMGELLKEYPRDSFYLSSKFPGYDISNFGKHEEIFEKQLEKCQVDYFDFYFIHNVCELNIDYYLDEDKYHTIAYFLEQKAKGRIKHLGFSSHGTVETLTRFLDRFGDQMEFAMIQLNYLDYTLQRGKEKVELLNSRNLPIWVMEPLRGGTLADMPADQFNNIKDLRENSTPIEWAFKFLQSIPGVTVILSGMSNMKQMEEKIKLFEEKDALDLTEFIAILEFAKDVFSEKMIPCTGCRYCVSHCPQHLDIPAIVKAYNENVISEGGFLAPFFIQALPEDKRPSACIGCKSCEKVCTQQIKLADIMQAFGKEMDEKLAAMFKATE